MGTFFGTIFITIAIGIMIIALLIEFRWAILVIAILGYCFLADPTKILDFILSIPVYIIGVIIFGIIAKFLGK